MIRASRILILVSSALAAVAGIILAWSCIFELAVGNLDGIAQGIYALLAFAATALFIWQSEIITDRKKARIAAEKAKKRETMSNLELMRETALATKW